jgi:hypothetical protein
LTSSSSVSNSENASRLYSTRGSRWPVRAEADPTLEMVQLVEMVAPVIVEDAQVEMPLQVAHHLGR